VNIILKDHFKARTAEIEDAISDSIGANTVKGMASILKIDKGKRMNLTVKADKSVRSEPAWRSVDFSTKAGTMWIPMLAQPAALRSGYWSHNAL
jgi:CelD/BcsL family acetyltransferase involved in cellulose biosynthesis